MQDMGRSRKIDAVAWESYPRRKIVFLLVPYGTNLDIWE